MCYILFFISFSFLPSPNTKTSGSLRVATERVVMAANSITTIVQYLQLVPLKCHMPASKADTTIIILNQHPGEIPMTGMD